MKRITFILATVFIYANINAQSSTKYDCNRDESIDGVYVNMKEDAVFNNGKGKYMDWLLKKIDSLKLKERIRKNIPIPMDSVAGIKVEFKISKEGIVKDISLCCLRGCYIGEFDGDITEDIKRIFLQSPVWKPALTPYGKPIEISKIQPIYFDLTVPVLPKKVNTKPDNKPVKRTITKAQKKAIKAKANKQP
jgi:hypothetical protein